jgi:hypothetical protein
MSSTEAEYNALVNGAAEAMWVESLFKELSSVIIFYGPIILRLHT